MLSHHTSILNHILTLIFATDILRMKKFIEEEAVEEEPELEKAEEQPITITQ